MDNDEDQHDEQPTDHEQAANQSQGNGDDEENYLDGAYDSGSDAFDEELVEARNNIRREAKKSKELRDEDNLGDCSQPDDCIAEEVGADEHVGGDENAPEEVGTDPEYVNSDDEHSFEEDSSEDGNGNIRMRKSKRVFFNPESNVPAFLVGMVFKNVTEFRMAVAKYAIARGVEIKFKKNENTRVRCRCKQACPWVLYASLEKKSGDFLIKTYNPNHRCTRIWKNKRASCDYLVSYFRDIIEEHPEITCSKMCEHVKKKLKLEINETMAKRVKRTIMTELEGDYKDNYRRLWDYAEELRQTNRWRSTTYIYLWYVTFTNDKV